MKVLIVGRTKMGGTSRCIGAISEEGRSLRFLNSGGRLWDVQAPFQIGQIWETSYSPVAVLIPPHTEDVIVSQYRLVSAVTDLRGHLLARIKPWRGDIRQVFEDAVDYTTNNNGYICQRRGVPGYSTGFWITKDGLTLREDGKHYDDVLGFPPRGLAYVGEPPPLPTLPAGTLVRVSLARWWKPENAAPDFEERCYLQLSGWFL